MLKEERMLEMSTETSASEDEQLKVQDVDSNRIQAFHIQREKLFFKLKTRKNRYVQV